MGMWAGCGPQFPARRRLECIFVILCGKYVDPQNGDKYSLHVVKKVFARFLVTHSELLCVPH